jgi:hypothetical protein
MTGLEEAGAKNRRLFLQCRNEDLRPRLLHDPQWRKLLLSPRRRPRPGNGNQLVDHCFDVAGKVGKAVIRHETGMNLDQKAGQNIRRQRSVWRQLMHQLGSMIGSISHLAALPCQSDKNGSLRATSGEPTPHNFYHGRIRFGNVKGISRGRWAARKRKTAPYMMNGAALKRIRVEGTCNDCSLQAWQRPTLPCLKTKYHWR